MLDWLTNPFQAVGTYFASKKPATRVDHRAQGQDAALILIHGFSGNTGATWSGLVDLLLREPKIATWDIFGLGFPTSLRVDVPGIWAADPDLTILSQGLRTSLSLPPLNRYSALAIAAHSMGGLVIQRALLDDELIANRIVHLLLLGTPSNGLAKARLLGRWKRQIRDMATNSPFILSLRKNWSDKYATQTPFSLRVIAGDRDEFVPSTSSLSPFPSRTQAVVPGNHLEIAKPTSADHETFQFFVESLSGGQSVRPVVDGARLALELRHFQTAVNTLLPRAAELDDNALVSLALALEGIGRGPEALAVLEDRYRGGTSSTEALGVLGGRLKRRWLVERIQADFARARELYARGLEQAESSGDHDQAYYHAINIAFLDLMAIPPASGITAEVRLMAERANSHCETAAHTNWRLATAGEAQLMLENLETAIALYSAAIEKTVSPRQIESMYSQAVQVAERVFGQEGVSRIERVFDLPRS